MAEFDRLSTLMRRFQLSVTPAAVENACLVILANAKGEPEKVIFCPEGQQELPAGLVVFSAHVDWENGVNPLLQALPRKVTLNISDDPQSQSLVKLIGQEAEASRCGTISVLGRLCEVLIVRLLRELMRSGTVDTGLMAGLADERLSRAIVSMHDKPERQWTVDDLAYVAGLSPSRFSEVFAATVGESPMAYLRRWRLILSRQDLAGGDRVDAVARRYGYGSPEGFSRAFRRHYGQTPLKVRLGA